MEKKKADTLQEVKDRMAKMQEEKNKQLEEIKEKEEAARVSLEEAKKAVKEATERMDLEAYENAKKEEGKARSAIEMYSARYNQIRQQEYISENESDKVLQSLEAYEEEKAAAFKTEALELLKQLNELYENYRSEIDDTEHTMRIWQQSIHANYRSKTTTYSETGTNRSMRPIPYRANIYLGCDEALRIGDFLKKEKDLKFFII